MPETSQTEEMKRYLFHEMTEKEREAVEERFFEDSAYFYDLTELENDLIDSYARNELTGTNLTRFEKSLTKSPEIREKVSNARALQTLIDEEKPEAAPVAVPTLWERISGFFNLKTSTLQYATGALVILLICAAGFLVLRNWQRSQEFAEREKRREAEIIELENQKRQLEEQKRIEEERRQNENKKQFENANGNTQPTSNVSSIEDEKRKSEINRDLEKINRELEDRKKNNPPQKTGETSAPEPLLAYVRPTGRGGITVKPTADQVITRGGEPMFKITVPLPADKNYGSYEITTSNGETISGTIPEGAKSFEFDLSPKNPNFEINVSERATRGGSESLGTYTLELKKRR